MTSIIAKAGIAALIALGALSGTAATAAASEFNLGIYVDSPYGHDRGRHFEDRGRRHGWDRPRFGCSPGEAIEKARWSGLRRVRVEDVSPRRIVVSGVRRGDWDRMAFANARGCPTIRR